MEAPAHLAEEALLDAYLSIQNALEEVGGIPRREPTRLERYAFALQLTGALQLGFLIAAFTLFVSFIVLNLVFHVD